MTPEEIEADLKQLHSGARRTLVMLAEAEARLTERLREDAATARKDVSQLSLDVLLIKSRHEFWSGLMPSPWLGGILSGFLVLAAFAAIWYVAKVDIRVEILERAAQESRASK